MMCFYCGTPRGVGVSTICIKALLCVSMLLVVSRTEARTWNILVDGTGDAPTIQAGIDSSGAGDVVLVHSGTYFENIDFLGKDIVVRSQTGPQGTVIDGSGNEDSVVGFVSGEPESARLEGFTIQGGVGRRLPERTSRAGGGILIIDSSPVIEGNIIRDNTTGAGAGWGGGLLMDSSRYDIEFPTPWIVNNVFERNRSTINGGGISATGVRSRVERNVFRENEARFDGGGMYVSMDGVGSIEIRNNQFWENVAGDHGGGIEFGRQGQSEPVLLEFNLFVRNAAHGNDGASDNGTGGAVSMRGWEGTLRNNTFADNRGTGGNGCTGGGILLVGGSREVLVENNLFYASAGCGIVCRALEGAEGATLKNNLFWSNAPYDINQPPECTIGTIENNLFDVDPLLCGPEMDNYTVSNQSPALAANPPIGVWTNPGCGDGVPVESTTWGRIKTRFRSN